MSGRARVWKLLACTTLLAVACKERGSSEQDSRPLPTPEPPASATPTTARDDAAKKRVEDDTKEAAKPKRPATDASDPKPASGPVATAAGGAASGGAPSGTAGAAPVASAPATPSLPSSVPGITAPSAACLSRCQGAMQTCLSQPVDGGVPGFGNLDLCKKAFEACQASCK